jgi:hypothetical protein
MKGLNKLRGKNPRMRLDDDEEGDAPLATNQYGADPFATQYQQSSTGSPLAMRRNNPSVPRPNPPVQQSPAAPYGGDRYVGAYAGGATAGAVVDPGAAARAQREQEQREQEELELAMAISASMEEATSRRARPPPPPHIAGADDEEAQLRRALELSRLEAEPDLMGGGEEPKAQAAPVSSSYDDLLSSPAPPPAPTNPLSDLNALFAAGAPAATAPPQTGQRSPAHHGAHPQYGMLQHSPYGMQPQSPHSPYGMQQPRSPHSPYGMSQQHPHMQQQPMGAMPMGGQMGMQHRPQMHQQGMMQQGYGQQGYGQQGYGQQGYGGMGGGGMGGGMQQPMTQHQPQAHQPMMGANAPAASPFAAPPSNFMSAPLPSSDPFGWP